MKIHSRNYSYLAEQAKKIDRFDYFKCFDFLKSNFKKDYVFRLSYSISSKIIKDRNLLNSIPSYISLSGSNSIRDVLFVSDGFLISSLDFLKKKEIFLISA